MVFLDAALRSNGVLRTVHVVCQDSCTEFNRVKAESSSGPSLREKQLRDLAMAYDCFMDLKNNIEEGMQVCDGVC